MPPICRSWRRSWNFLAVLAGVGAGLIAPAMAQLGIYTGRFAGGPGAEGVTLELYEVEGGALAGQLDTGASGRFVVTGHPSAAGVQGIISGDVDHAFFHLETRASGLRFVFVPAASDGRPSYEAARILELNRTAPGLALSVPPPPAVEPASAPLAAPSAPRRAGEPDLTIPPLDPVPVGAEDLRVRGAQPAGAGPNPRPRPALRPGGAAERAAIAPPAAPPDEVPAPAGASFDAQAMARELGVDAIGFGGPAPAPVLEPAAPAMPVAKPAARAKPQPAEGADTPITLPPSRDPLLRYR